MTRIVTFPFLLALPIALLTACGSDYSGSKKAENEFTYFAKPASETILSFNKTNNEIKEIVSKPKLLDLADQYDSQGREIFGTMFYLKDQRWYQVSATTNAAAQVSSALISNEVCDNEAFGSVGKAYLFYSTPGADNDCGKTADNRYWRIDSSQTSSDAPLAIANAAVADNYDADAVVINNNLTGMVIRTGERGDTLLYANLDGETVQLKTGIDAPVHVFNFANHSSVILRIGSDLYDVTATQLAAGELGEAFYTSSNSWTEAESLHSGTFVYADSAKLYHYNLASKTSTLVYNDNGADNSNPTADIRNIDLGQNSAVVRTQFGALTRYKLVNFTSVSAPVVTELNLTIANASSTLYAVEGGFVSGGTNTDKSRVASLISNAGKVTNIENASWVNVASPINSENNLPVLLNYGETNNSLVAWSAAQSKPLHVLAQFDKNVEAVRLDPYTSKNGVALLSTLDADGRNYGGIYSLNVLKSNSLKRIGNDTGFSVFH